MPSAKNQARLASKRKITKTNEHGEVKQPLGQEYERTLIKTQRLRFLVYSYLSNVCGVDLISEESMRKTVDLLGLLHNKHRVVAEMEVYADLCLSLDASEIQEYPPEVVSKAHEIAQKAGIQI